LERKAGTVWIKLPEVLLQKKNYELRIKK
jgi:hypothetical protein